MRTIDLAAAAGHVKQACEENLKLGERLPFFFLVGSGLSYPPVPLASRIEQDCKEASLARSRGAPPGGKRLIDTYSHWFDQAYPHPVERQRYLRGLIEGTCISHANFRLAHLLLEKQVANLVITTNFDDFLSRALNLFGKPHIVCDHPRTVERISPESDDLQIVHVHGTYWFYDCCNLSGEIEERSRSSADNSMTMASLLDTILGARSPLVIGYGGWEGDVVMSALKRRLQNRLPYNLYWFCYRENEIQSLPSFLRHHPNVYFVVASRPSPAAETPPPAGGGMVASQETPQAAKPAEYQTLDPVLPAQKVLDELIRVFNLPAPQLTQDPLAYFADYLRRSLPAQDAISAESDIYSLVSVIERIEAARRSGALKKQESMMERVRDRLRRSQYREAIQLGASLAGTKLAARDTRDLLRTMLTAAWRLDDSSAEEIQGYDVAIQLGESVPKPDTYIRERMAMAMVNKGLALAGSNRHKEAIAVFDEAYKRYAREPDQFFRQQVAEAMFNKAYSLDASGRKDSAVDAYQQLLKRLGEPNEPELQEMAAMALLNRGFIFGEIKRPKEEIADYDEIVRRFAAAKDPDLQVYAAQALYNKGVALDSAGSRKRAVAAFERLIKLYELSRNRAMRDLVDAARSSLAQGEEEA